MGPLFEGIRLDGRIRNFILAGQWEDPVTEEFGVFFYPGEEPEGERDDSGSFGEKQYCRWTQALFNNKGGRMCILTGPDGIGKKNTGAQVCGRDGNGRLFLPMERLLCRLRTGSLRRPCAICCGNAESNSLSSVSGG